MDFEEEIQNPNAKALDNPEPRAPHSHCQVVVDYHSGQEKDPTCGLCTRTPEDVDTVGIEFRSTRPLTSPSERENISKAAMGLVTTLGEEFNRRRHKETRYTPAIEELPEEREFPKHSSTGEADDEADVRNTVSGSKIHPCPSEHQMEVRAPDSKQISHVQERSFNSISVTYKAVDGMSVLKSNSTRKTLSEGKDGNTTDEEQLVSSKYPRHAILSYHSVGRSSRVSRDTLNIYEQRSRRNLDGCLFRCLYSLFGCTQSKGEDEMAEKQKDRVQKRVNSDRKVTHPVQKDYAWIGERRGSGKRSIRSANDSFFDARSGLGTSSRPASAQSWSRTSSGINKEALKTAIEDRQTKRNGFWRRLTCGLFTKEDSVIVLRELPEYISSREEVYYQKRLMPKDSVYVTAERRKSSLKKKTSRSVQSSSEEETGVLTFDPKRREKRTSREMTYPSTSALSGPSSRTDNIPKQISAEIPVGVPDHYSRKHSDPISIPRRNPNSDLIQNPKSFVCSSARRSQMSTYWK